MMMSAESEMPTLLDPSSPLIGSLTAGERQYFQIDTTNKDALIILESIGGGDIDLYCTPADGLLGLMKPSPSFSVGSPSTVQDTTMSSSGVVTASIPQR